MLAGSAVVRSLTVDRGLVLNRFHVPAAGARHVVLDEIGGDLRAVGQVELVIQAADVVANRLLTELQLRGDLRVVCTLRNHLKHVRLPLRQVSRRLLAEDPSGGLMAENLITQVDGDDGSSDRLGGGVLQ